MIIFGCGLARLKNWPGQHNWVVIRLSEYVLVSNLPNCFVRIKKAIQKLGGVICISEELLKGRKI